MSRFNAFYPFKICLNVFFYIYTYNYYKLAKQVLF